jgi:hypothetical protein
LGTGSSAHIKLKGYHRATYPCEVTSIELQKLLSSIGIPVIADLPINPLIADSPHPK